METLAKMYRLCFLKNKRKRDFEDLLAKAIKNGAKSFGDTIKIVAVPESLDDIPLDYNGYIIFGCSDKRRYFDYAKKLGKDIVVIDKGYTRNGDLDRETTLLRCSVNSFQPTDFLKKAQKKGDRWKKLNIDVKETDCCGNCIVFAGGSQKYCDWHGLGDANKYAKTVLLKIRESCEDRDIIYRPKPGRPAEENKPIDGFLHSSSGNIDNLLKDCFNLVTFGSNAAIEAAIHGVPTTVLGDGVARQISCTKIDMNNLYIPTMEEKMKLLFNLSYCQWNRIEFSTGEAWSHIRKQLYNKEN